MTLLQTSIITKSIQKVNEQLQILPKEKIDRLEKNARIDDGIEFVAYQNAQSRAFASGRIEFDDAQWLYNMINSFNKQPLADRIVALEFLSQLVVK